MKCAGVIHRTIHTGRSRRENVKQDVAKFGLGPALVRHWLRGIGEQSGFEIMIRLTRDWGIGRTAANGPRGVTKQDEIGGKKGTGGFHVAAVSDVVDQVRGIHRLHKKKRKPGNRIDIRHEP